MSDIFVIGAGGMTRSSLNILKSYYPENTIKIVDVNYNKSVKESIHSFDVSGRPESINKTAKVFLSIGDNEIREIYFKQFHSQIIKKNISHKSSIIEKGSSFGISNQIYAQSYINSYCSVGDNNIINTSAILEHETTINNHNYISIGALIAGRVSIGSGCYIGAGSTILENLEICDNVTIGAGAVVTKDIHHPGTYIGVPAKLIT